MIDSKIAFIGAGNMGGAMLRGVVNGKVQSPSKIYVYDAYEPLKTKICTEVGANPCADEIEAIKSAKYIIIAVKPDKVHEVWSKISEYANGKTIISIAAGKQLSYYKDIANTAANYVRTIPNLPAMVGEGITGLYFENQEGEQVSDAIKKDVKKIFSSFGKVIEFESESKIDKMISVTSSSPAYVCMMVEAMADAAVKAGFKRDDAYFMVEQAIYGTCAYLIDQGIHPGVLKDRVCSPGGTTIEAVASLEKSGFRACLMDAMDACDKKNESLGKN